MDVRILVVADDRLVRAGLAALLAGETGCLVVGQIAAEDLDPSLLAVYRPAVVLWDLGWEPDRHLERLGGLRDRGVPIIALIAHDDQAAALWVGGVRGLIRRDATTEELTAALQAVSAGLAVLDPTLAGAVRGRIPSPQPIFSEELTGRERDVLHLLAEGMSNKAIAQRLGH